MRMIRYLVAFKISRFFFIVELMKICRPIETNEIIELTEWKFLYKMFFWILGQKRFYANLCFYFFNRIIQKSNKNIQKSIKYPDRI